MGGPDHATAAEPTFRLLGADGRPHSSATPGRLGGNRRSRPYGRPAVRAAGLPGGAARTCPARMPLGAVRNRAERRSGVSFLSVAAGAVSTELAQLGQSYRLLIAISGSGNDAFGHEMWARFGSCEIGRERGGICGRDGVVAVPCAVSRMITAARSSSREGCVP